MKDDRTLLTMFKNLIWTETKYLRHYYAFIISVDDPDKEGKVKAVCFDLGWTNRTAVWIPPRDKNGLSVPKVNDWIEIYFMLGDCNKPVYVGKATEMQGMTPKNYSSPKTHVIFEDPENKCNIKFDAMTSLLTFFKGNKSYVLGEDLLTAFNSHVHTSTAPGSPTSTPAVPLTAGILSTKIKGE